MKTTINYLVATLIVACTLFFKLNGQSFLVDKYLPSANKNRETLSTNITRLNITRNGEIVSIPIVAVALDTMIDLNWWNYSEGNWNVIESRHEPCLPAYNPAADMSPWNWSSDIGLSSVNNKVFLISKRTAQNYITGLQLKVFAWDNNHETLNSTTPDWITFPLSSFGYSRSGFRLWAGSTDKDFFFLTQVFKQINNMEVPELVLFKLINASTSDPSLSSSWDTLEIGEGGWEFDGMISGTNLECVYRTNRYSMSFPVTLPEQSNDSVILNIPSDQIGSYYAPLTRTSIDLFNFVIRNREENIPGGDHPRIQRIEPFYVTYDRITGGSFTIKRVDVPVLRGIRNPELSGGISSLSNQLQLFKSNNNIFISYIYNLAVPYTMRKTYIITPSVSGISKGIIRKIIQGWSSGSLMERTQSIIPRNMTYIPGIDEIINLVPDNYPCIQYSTLCSPLPVYITNVTDKSDQKGELLDVVYHRSEYESVFLSRFFVNTSSPDLDPVERASEILDINHGTIHNWTRIENDFRMHPFLPSNNIQFRPITYTLRKYSYPDVPVTVSGFPLRIVDNTIGGSLVVELGSDRPHFMAYSDLGDGNTRVIFDDNMPPPKLGRIPQKGFDSTIVTGPGSSSDHWININYSSVWQPTYLPVYESDNNNVLNNQAIVTGLDPKLDEIIALASISENGVYETKEYQVLALEQLYHNWNQPGESYSSSGPAGTNTYFTYNPIAPFPGLDVTFIAVSELVPENIVNYSWDFGDGSVITQTEPEIQHEFQYNYTQSQTLYNVKLTISTVNGESVTSETTIKVQPPLWTDLWQIHNSIQKPGLAIVGNLAVAFSKYNINYNMDHGSPSSMDFTIQPKYNTELRLLQNPNGQGYIDLRIPLNLSSEDVSVQGIYSNFFAINKFSANIYAGERFTPGILTFEERGEDPLTNNYVLEDILGPDEEALACKPLEDYSFSVGSINIDGNLTLTGMTLLGLATILVTIGLVWLATIISDTIAAAVAAASSSPWGWIAALLIIGGLIIFVENNVPGAVDNLIENQIVNSLNSNGNIKTLTEDLLDNAGEGVAEAIAVQAIGNNAPSTGTNRFKKQYWQMIYVLDNKCRILIRQ